MDVLSIKGTSQYPEVLLDRIKGRLEFSGNSLPEDAKNFFEPIIIWIDNYLQSPSEKTIISFRMNYYNTPTSRILFKLLKKFEDIHKIGNTEVVIEWNYPDDDIDMKDAGNDYSANIKVPFELKSYSE
ncbi:MAG: DUF1987 domain-containing protein [Bacteroidales bacterium]|nr:DUF1987 domain-containing protein [Bacteroidales bacterium]MDD3892504.1 DUF1987 domain-containing protein [Bacteroidales bacterium]